MNKNPIEPRRLSETLCMDNDKQIKESALRLAHNGRNQEARGNCNEKF
jgi:hypothetical protein